MAGLLTAVIEYTTSARAGLMMGVWGTAAEIGQTMGGVLGGAVVDAMRWLTGGDALIAYSALFTLEGAAGDRAGSGRRSARQDSGASGRRLRGRPGGRHGRGLRLTAPFRAAGRAPCGAPGA